MWVPADRLLAVMGRYQGSVWSLPAGIQRKWSLLRSGKQSYVSIDTVDRMLIEMDLDVWLRLPAEDGGLEDIYFGGKQYGSPDHTARTVADVDRVLVECRGCGSSRSVLKRNAVRARAQLCGSCGRRERESRPGGRYELVLVACAECGVGRQVQAHYAEAAALRRCNRCANKPKILPLVLPAAPDSLAA